MRADQTKRAVGTKSHQGGRTTSEINMGLKGRGMWGSRAYSVAGEEAIEAAFGTDGSRRRFFAGGCVHRAGAEPQETYGGGARVLRFGVFGRRRALLVFGGVVAILLLLLLFFVALRRRGYGDAVGIEHPLNFRPRAVVFLFAEPMVGRAAAAVAAAVGSLRLSALTHKERFAGARPGWRAKAELGVVLCCRRRLRSS